MGPFITPRRWPINPTFQPGLVGDPDQPDAPPAPAPYSATNEGPLQVMPRREPPQIDEPIAPSPQQKQDQFGHDEAEKAPPGYYGPQNLPRDDPGFGNAPVVPRRQSDIDAFRNLQGPEPPRDNRAQSIVKGVLSPFLGPQMTQDIMHPVAAQQERNYQGQRRELAQNVGMEQRQQQIEETKKRNQSYDDQVAAAQADKEDKAKNRPFELMKSLYAIGASPVQEGEALDPKIHTVFKGPDEKQYKVPTEEERRRRMQESLTQNWVPIPADVAKKLGIPAGQKVPATELDNLIKVSTPAVEKPITAEQNKLAFEAILQKLHGETPIDPAAYTDVGKLSKIINASKVITPQEKAKASAYLAANTTPAAQGSTGTMRMQVLMEGRPVQVLDDQGTVHYDTAGNAIRTNAPAAGNISGSMRTDRSFAKTITDQVPALAGDVAKLKDKVGPVAGRWKQLWVNKAGLNDPDFAALDQDLKMYATAIVRVHFGKSGGENIRKELEKNFSTAQSPEDLIARIEHADTWVRGYSTMGNKKSGTKPTLDQPQGQTAPAKVTTKAQYDALPKGASYIDTQDNKTYQKK